METSETLRSVETQSTLSLSALIRTSTLLVLQCVTGSVSKPHSSVQMALFRLHGNLTLFKSTDALPAAQRRRRRSLSFSLRRFYKPSAVWSKSHLQPLYLFCSPFFFSHVVRFVQEEAGVVTFNRNPVSGAFNRALSGSVYTAADYPNTFA